MFRRAPKPVRIEVFGKTDLGKTRDHNEDCFLVADLTREEASLQPSVRDHVVGPHGTIFVVADGMGGAAAGELRSGGRRVGKERRSRWSPGYSKKTHHDGGCM